MNMLENIANAIDFADEAYVANYPGDPLAARAGPKWSEAIASAVIDAMREPTRLMWAVGGDAVVGYKQRNHDKVVEGVWNGMLDAAAAEGE